MRNAGSKSLRTRSKTFLVRKFRTRAEMSGAATAPPARAAKAGPCHRITIEFALCRRVALAMRD